MVIMSEERKLYPEDQARVDEYLRTGYNDVPRKPFRPIFMVILLTTVTFLFSFLSVWIAHHAGIYW
jgi:uncharacterized membrane protein